MTDNADAGGRVYRQCVSNSILLTMVARVRGASRRCLSVVRGFIQIQTDFRRSNNVLSDLNIYIIVDI